MNQVDPWRHSAHLASSGHDVEQTGQSENVNGSAEGARESGDGAHLGQKDGEDDASGEEDQIEAENVVETRIHGIEEGVEELRAEDVGEQRENGHHLEEEEDSSDHRQSVGTREIVEKILPNGIERFLIHFSSF